MHLLHPASSRLARRAAPQGNTRKRSSGRRIRAAKVSGGNEEFCSITDPDCDFPDPESKFHKYGRDFGKQYKLNFDWFEDVPRVRVRRPDEVAMARQREELVEIAVLNARLAGISPWEARKQLEYLRLKRKNWEKIYTYVTKQDAAATISLITEASQKIEEALSEEARENKSVSDLKEELMQLQTEVNTASERLNLTQARVENNLQRINDLKAEAAALERLKQVQASVVRTAVAEPATTSTPRPQLTTGATSTVAGSRPGKARPQRDRGLRSSLEIEENLRNFWYPAEFSKKLAVNTLVPFEIFGEPWVLFRDEFGAAACVRDECAHRACPLSLGTVEEGRVTCPYHGWQYNSDGACTHMPSTQQCRGIAVSALPTAEKDGFVWVWPGRGAPPEVPSFTAPPQGYDIHAEIMVDVPVEHGLLMENLLDLAHAPFTHTTTFARGWPVPDVVKFHASKLLSGSWDPYPISMSFEPPCMVLSTIGLAQPGKIMRGARAEECERHLHQLHICLPSKKGHTRLLYRMSLDFMPWARFIPGIQQIWKNVAGQVLGEDLVLVAGQQARMKAGRDTWANPVSYDKLAVRYRRWRNSVADGTVGAAQRERISMDAGEMFAPDEAFVDQMGR